MTYLASSALWTEIEESIQDSNIEGERNTRHKELLNNNVETIKSFCLFYWPEHSKKWELELLVQQPEEISIKLHTYTHRHTLAKRDRACKALILTILSAHARTHAHTHTISHCSKWDLLHQPSACHPFLMGWLKAWLPWWITPCLKERESERERERKSQMGSRAEAREEREWRGGGGRGRRAGTGSSDVSFEAPHKAMKSWGHGWRALK